MEFNKVNEDESYFPIYDFRRFVEDPSFACTFQPHSSVDDLLHEASFTLEYFCGITISETGISQGEFDALSEIDGDFKSVWPQMEEAYRRSNEGACEKELNLRCDGVESGEKKMQRRFAEDPSLACTTFQSHPSADDYRQEAAFTLEHFCAIAISKTSISKGELDALSEINGDFTSIWPQMEDAYHKSKQGDGVESGKSNVQGGGADNKTLTFEQVSRYFSMPIMQAARELNVGLTALKKQCRMLGIPRWPHRKVKSLQALINNVRELGKETEEFDGHRTRTLVAMLQQTKKQIEERPATMLDKGTMQLRQACFKENFKKRRRLMGNMAHPQGDSAC